MFNSIKKIYFFFSLFLFTGTFTSATTPPPPPSQTNKLKVVASFSILGDFIRQIGKDLVDVTIIVPENADPHVYQPNPRDAKLLAQADLIMTNGLGFEGWLDRLIDNSGYKGQIVVATKGVTARPISPELEAKSKTQSAKDPHAWHSVPNAILYVNEIAEALKKALPEHKETLSKNQHIYINELKELDTWIRQEYGAIPPCKRYVVTTHDAFWYYGDTYNVHFLAPVGISTDAEPAAAAVAQLIRDIRERDIHAVFIENLSNGKLIEEIAREAKITLGGTLYADSLSGSIPGDKPLKDPSPATTYSDMMRHNTREIVNALKA